MAATIRVTCTYETPQGLEWAGKLNSSFHPPHATLAGQETTLKWDEPTDLDVTPGRSCNLEVYLRAFDILRICGAEVTIEPMWDGETRSYRYVVALKDRYLDHGHLSLVG